MGEEKNRPNNGKNTNIYKEKTEEKQKELSCEWQSPSGDGRI